MKRGHKLFCILLAVCGFASGITSPVVHAAAPADAVAKVEALGGAVRLLANTSAAVEVDFQCTPKSLKSEDLGFLQSIEQLRVLRLSNTDVTDAQLSQIAKLANLKRLDLSATAIADAGLNNLSGLKQLESLNLFGSAVTDAGLDIVARWPALKQLFVGQTKVSADGLARLHKSVPALHITPDPVAEREDVRIIAETAAAALARAQEALPLVKKSSEQVIAEAERVKKESEEFTRRAEKSPQNKELSKQADEKKQAEAEAAKKAVKAKEAVAAAERAVVSAQQQSEEAQREVARLATKQF